MITREKFIIYLQTIESSPTESSDGQRMMPSPESPTITYPQQPKGLYSLESGRHQQNLSKFVNPSLTKGYLFCLFTQKFVNPTSIKFGKPNKPHINKVCKNLKRNAKNVYLDTLLSGAMDEVQTIFSWEKGEKQLAIC